MIGPGSLYTSVVPNLLVSGIPEAIRKSPAIKAYFVNLMWQPGETPEFSASDHVRGPEQNADATPARNRHIARLPPKCSRRLTQMSRRYNRPAEITNRSAWNMRRGEPGRARCKGLAASSSPKRARTAKGRRLPGSADARAPF